MDLIVGGLITLILGGAIAYIRKERKAGNVCIGCSHGKSCSGCCHSTEE